MKNTYSYILSGVLAVAIIVLYILHFTSTSGSNGGAAKGGNSLVGDSSVVLPVAYVNLDSLLHNYNFAKDINETLMRNQENSRSTLNQKDQQLQAAAQEFDRKLRNNAFLSDERAKQEQQRILKMQEEYQQTAQRLSQEFAIEQQKLNIELEDTIKVHIAEFNKTQGYQIIFSNTGTANILYGDIKYDITGEVIEFLNNRYGPATSGSSPK